MLHPLLFIANGFEPLLVSDEHPRFNNRSYVNAQHNPAVRLQGHFDQSVGIAAPHHINQSGPNRRGEGNFQNRERLHHNEAYGGSGTNRNGGRRQVPRGNRRNWGHSLQPRQFHGNCYICGKFLISA